MIAVKILWKEPQELCLKNKDTNQKNIDLISATIEQLKKEGKQEAAKIVKLSCNNSCEKSSDLLKKYKIIQKFKSLQLEKHWVL